MMCKWCVNDMNKKSESLDERCDYILKFCDDIYVEEQINGKWGKYRLSEIPARLALKHAMTWIKEGTIPRRTIRDEEQKRIVANSSEIDACNLGYFSETGCDY